MIFKLRTKENKALHSSERPSVGIVAFCLVLLMCQMNDEVVLLDVNNFYRAEVLRQRQSACSASDEHVLRVTDLQSARAWIPARDLLDGRNRGVSMDILAIRWISKDSLRVERRITDNGLRGDLIYEVSSQAFVDVSSGDYSGEKSR